MKLLNKKQKNNSGFSLVELIVVIAIMVVLVAVLAPLFTRYIESSRRSTDVSNANSIAQAVLADAADGKTYTAGENGKVEVKKGTPTAIADDVKVKGSKEKNNSFYFTYDAGKNTCAVYAGGDTRDLTNETDAQSYKDRTGE